MAYKLIKKGHNLRKLQTHLNITQIAEKCGII